MNTCACGCGNAVKNGNRFVHGHNNRGKPSPRKIQPTIPAPLCACGCGKQTKWNKSTRQWNRYIYPHGRKGTSHRVESRRKMSDTKRDNPPSSIFKSGSDNPQYKHGHGYRRPSSSILIRLRKTLIAQRGFRCERCGITPDQAHNLHMHHRDDDTFNNAADNLQLLCVACHNSITHAM